MLLPRRSEHWMKVDRWQCLHVWKSLARSNSHFSLLLIVMSPNKCHAEIFARGASWNAPVSLCAEPLAFSIARLFLWVRRERIYQNICQGMCCRAFVICLSPKFIIILVLQILNILFYIWSNILLESSALVCSHLLKSTDSLKVWQRTQRYYFLLTIFI